MAVSIGSFVVALTGIEASGAIVFSATAYAAVGTAVLIGADLAVSAILAPSAQKAGAQQFAVKQAIPVRRRYYGKNKASGAYAFIQTKDGNLYEVLLIAPHEIGFLEHWIGDRAVTLDGSGNVTTASMLDSGVQRFHILTKPGTVSQTAHALLITDFPTLLTSNHKNLGIANVLFKQDGVESKKFTNFYPGGAQNYRTVFNGDRVWDVNAPAQSLGDPTTWALGHDNAANVIRDFLTSSDGFRMPTTAINLGPFQAAATVCDETVTLANSTTDKRYRLSGGYDLDAAPKDTLQKLLTSCDGLLYLGGDGKLGLKVGKWIEPTVTIADDHIHSFNLPKGLGPLREANEILGQFVDANQDYQPVQAQSWRDETDISNRGLLSKALDTIFCPTHNQARRMMKVAAARANPERVGTITTDFYGLNALGERFIRVTINRRNIDMTMEITSFKIDTANAECNIGVCAMTADAWDFAAAFDEGSITLPGSTASGNPTVTAPTQPTGITANNSSGTVSIMFAAPNDVNVYACRVWRGTTVFSSAVDISSQIFCAPSQFLTWSDTPGSGTWKYWATAESVSGNPSTEDGPATVVV